MKNNSVDEKAKIEKRREQNRINQRNYRKRMRDLAKESKNESTPPKPQANLSFSPSHSTPHRSETLLLDSPSDATHSITGPEDIKDAPNQKSTALASWRPCAIQKHQLHKLNPPQLRQMMHNIEAAARRNYQLGSPRTDQLLTLIQFNVFRALVSNTSSMGFTMGWLREDAISPWITDDGGGRTLAKCPPSLRPTALQRMIPHHPWIDLFPLPKMRDNLLLADSFYDEDRLCNDLIDFCDVPNEKSGLIVWGDPWNPASWEASEEFLETWSWVLKGCEEIRVSTNYWRKQRGEPRLDFRECAIP